MREKKKERSKGWSEKNAKKQGGENKRKKEKRQGANIATPAQQSVCVLYAVYISSTIHAIHHLLQTKATPTTCQTLLTQANDAHLEGPDPADPDLELGALGEALDALELDALPPAAAGGLAPEEQQLLGHADGAAAHVVAADVGAQPRQRQRADDGLVGLARPVAPVVVVVEAAGKEWGLGIVVSEFGLVVGY